MRLRWCPERRGELTETFVQAEDCGFGAFV